MSVTQYVTFVLVAAAQTATPGPSTVFLVNNALTLGRGRAVMVLTGDLLAIALLASLSAAGLGGLVTAEPVVFDGLRLFGAAYLAWLGIKYLGAEPKPVPADAGPSQPRDRDAARLWVQSFAVGISNPKAILFFSALFPQFIPAERGGFQILALLVATFVATKLVVLGGYAACAGRIKAMLGGGEGSVAARRLAGVLFLLFAAGIAWSVLR
jgi:threonine/homoserine/homoserine lactone efflux protein